MQAEIFETTLIDLSNVSILLNESNDFVSAMEYRSTVHELESKNLSVQPEDHGYLLAMSFDLIQLNTLSVLKGSVKVLEVEVGGYFTILSELRVSKLFNLETLSYFMEMKTVLKKQKMSQNGYAKVITTNEVSYLKHHVQVMFTSKEPFILGTECVSLVVVGKKMQKNEKKWPFAIQNLKITTHKPQHEPIFENRQQKPIIENLSFPEDYSYPLIDNLQLPLQSQQIDLSQKISQLDPYSCPKLSQFSSQQFFISHDMMNGYSQDINSFTPFRTPTQTHHYRFNYLNQTKIFNYFTHHPISIPPQKWRSLCKKYQLLCLGTFIVEPNELAIDQKSFMTEEFALKLIYIAKKAKFDGYLINIEVPIQNPVKLVSWLDFLTKNINQAIPGSQIVWYDSVVVNGQLSYQNQLNAYNKVFYQVSNGIFTNYWWKQESLLNSLKNMIPSKPVYIGNDCHGRKTYAGGKYQIVKAVQKIQQLGKGELTPALFAPGFTYEDDGQTMREKFRLNEIKMYHGTQIEERKIEKWRNTLNGGSGWKQEDEWAVTSHNLCKRQALVKIVQYKDNPGDLMIKFTCIVAGTGPKYHDYFKATLQVIDYKNDTVLMESTYPSTVAQEKQTLVEITLKISCSLINEKICVRILEEGKDVEFWAGNYGTRFKGETIDLIVSNDSSKWIESIPISPTSLDAKYTSFFNNGEGDHFYLMGRKGLPNYSSLSDFDLPPVLTLNKVSNVQISYEDSFIGGTSLKFQNTDKILFNYFDLNQNEEKERKFTIVIVTKGTKPIQIVCGATKCTFSEMDDEKNKFENGWKPFKSEIIFAKNLPEFAAQVKFSSNKGFVGEFSIFESSQQKQQQIQKNFQIAIKLNKQFRPLHPYHFDFVVSSSLQIKKPNSLQKILIKFGQFSGFIDMEVIAQKKQDSDQKQYRILGLLKGIPAIFDKDNPVQLTIFDLSHELPSAILSKILSKTEVQSLLQRNTLKLDFTF